MLGGNILPPPGWDPYGAAGQAPATAPLFSQDPYFQSQPNGMPNLIPVATLQKFVQDVRLDATWMPAQGSKKFGMTDAGADVTFAVPVFSNPQTPLLITPGFTFHFPNGPTQQLPDQPAELPPQLYDAYLDAAWNPQVTPWFGGEIGFRVGVYSDFKKVNNDSIRYTGFGLAALTFSPSFKIKAGVLYLDRVHIKLLPAGGIVWTPSSDVRFEILFPNPRIARRISTIGTTDWWLYGRGEYGGDSWTVVRGLGPPYQAQNGMVDRVDYNDYRAAIGLEFDRHNSISGLFEVGISFERELYYRSGTVYKPSTTYFLRGGLAF